MAVLVQCCAAVAIALLFLVHLTLCRSDTARECMDQGMVRCPKQCNSGYVWQHNQGYGCLEKTCQCQDPCEHHDCGFEKCVSKKMCRWGTERCLQYPTCQSKPRTIEPIKPMCEQPSSIGPCFGHMPRYFFNKTAGQCQMFIYGGCHGNDNNFVVERDCINACVGPDNTYCSLPAKTGVCFGHFPSFYYNSKTGNCEAFIFIGCNGNGNRFATLAECEKYCPYSPAPVPGPIIYCYSDGKTYAPGDTFPSTDGCNTCICNGKWGVVCTTMACVKTV